MNDEIKEILDNFKKYEARYKLHNETQFIITHREIQILLDYITNLQQENENTKEKAKNYLDIYEEMFDYKSRCEKANNQLKIIMQIIKEQPTRNIEDDEWLENRLIGVVNILQNGSENNED